MRKEPLFAASLVLLLAGQAAAAGELRRAQATPDKDPPAAVRKQPAKSVPQMAPAAVIRKEPAKPPASTFTVRPDRGKRDDDRQDDRNHDRHDHDWRDDDHRHGHDWDRNDWRRDDDWRRRGWHYHGWRSDGWRYYRAYDNRYWRYVPPYRYSLDFGYRSGYELAWRDWMRYGVHDRYWRRSAFYGYGVGNAYRAGYDAGWRDAADYYGRGYRPDYWSYDPHGGWYFGFHIGG